MRIVFGHNHFRIKSVQPHEIGLFNREFDNITFDLQQKYAHLYWIPFFPLGKVWTVNKGDGKKYVCHPEVEQMLNQNPGRGGKKAIFAWSGFLAIGLVLIFMSLMEKAQHYRYKQEYAAQMVTESNELQGMVDDASVNDYFLVQFKTAGTNSFNYTKIPLKVLAVKDDAVLLGSFAAADGYNKSYSDDHDIIEFIQRTGIQDSFWVKKAELKKGIQSASSETDNFQGVAIPAYFEEGTFKLAEIKHLEGPDPQEDYNAPGRSDTYFELVNYGFAAHADSIVATDPGITGKLSKRRDFRTDSSVALQLVGTGKYLLYLSNKQKHQYVYEIDNAENRLQITKL